MHILVSNDDGVHAPGIKALAEAMTLLGDVTTVAPDRNCSGASHSLTLENPLRLQRLENGLYSVKGTPSDCVHLAIHGLLTKAPDIVVSGINAGANLGDDVIYSGTVAAATEGRFLGLPAVAVSLVGQEHYETAAMVARQVVARLKQYPLAANYVLNINVPDLPPEALKGIKGARAGSRHQAESMLRTTDPAGKEIFWLGPPGEEQDAGADTDFAAVADGYAAVTPLKVDLTAHEQLTTVGTWLNGITITE